MFGQSVKKTNADLAKFVVPAISAFLTILFSDEIVDNVNLQIIAINSSLKPYLPTMWLIITALLTMGLLKLTFDIAIVLKDWFTPQPSKAQWISCVTSFIIVLAVEIINVFSIWQLVSYFIKNLP